MSDLELALWICGGLVVLWIIVRICKKGGRSGGFDVGDVFDVFDGD